MFSKAYAFYHETDMGRDETDETDETMGRMRRAQPREGKGCVRRDA
jgi:hypothetical protein